jgi:hypothetical protein
VRLDHQANPLLIGQFLHPLVLHQGRPELGWLRFWAGDLPDQTQEGFGSNRVGEVLFAVRGDELQLVTICNHLTAFLNEPVF